MSDLASTASHPSSSALLRLERWYSSMCNGDWEHTYGISIETLDNPGWMVSIEIKDTPLYDIPFEPMRREQSDQAWIQCEVTDGIWRGSCGGGQLSELLERFLVWAEAASLDD